MVIVADAGPILHLFWVGAASWALPSHTIDVVNEVWEEVNLHAPNALQDPRLRRVLAPISISQDIFHWNLDRGEQAALNYALTQRKLEYVLVLCDERQARLACEKLSLPVVGSILATTTGW